MDLPPPLNRAIRGITRTQLPPKKDQLLEDWLRATAELETARERHAPTRRLIADIRRVKGQLVVLIKAEQEQQTAKVGI